MPITFVHFGMAANLTATISAYALCFPSGFVSIVVRNEIQILHALAHTSVLEFLIGFAWRFSHPSWLISFLSYLLCTVGHASKVKNCRDHFKLIIYA
jgi:hypothetical protein